MLLGPGSAFAPLGSVAVRGCRRGSLPDEIFARQIVLQAFGALDASGVSCEFLSVLPEQWTSNVVKASPERRAAAVW